MSDIYELKAEKYKLKYLKLKQKQKQELEGGGGFFSFMHTETEADKLKNIIDNLIKAKTYTNEDIKIQYTKTINIRGKEYDNGYVYGTLKKFEQKYNNNNNNSNEPIYRYKNKKQIKELISKDYRDNLLPLILKKFDDIGLGYMEDRDYSYNDIILHYKRYYPIFSNSIPEEEIFKELNEKGIQLTKDEIYEKYILPIVKNIDIYIVSMFIYKQFFVKYKLKDQKYNNTNSLVEQLYNDAQYNRINGPKHLSDRLQIIIDSMPK
jgi:hypothetical protein